MHPPAFSSIAAAWSTFVLVPIRVLVVALAAIGSAAAPLRAADTEAEAAAEKRLLSAAAFLASDELEGRGIGTPGIDRAADYIAEQFRSLGLKTDLVDGGPFQPFEMTVSTELGPADANRLTLLGPPVEGGEPQSIELKLGTDFTPLAIGGSGTFDLELVFVGYGISADQPDRPFDEYAGIDVKDKAVVILRHNPQQNNPHGRFASAHGPSRHAYFSTKVSNAYQHGAKLVILCNSDVEIRKGVLSSTKRLKSSVENLAKSREELAKVLKAQEDESIVDRAAIEKLRQRIDRLVRSVESASKQLGASYDPILALRRAGTDAGGRDMPVLFCSRSKLDTIVQASLGKTLAKLEREIDSGPKPASAALAGCRAIGSASVVRKKAKVKNVVAVIEGTGPLAEETVVIGAHYDHLGRGRQGALDPGNEIRNGADDNASGIATLIEIARQFAERAGKPRRRIVFIAFTAEESGLIGSAHYVEHPLFPLEKTVAMLNLDMVGRLKDEKLIVQGVKTAATFPAMIDRAEKDSGMSITRKPGGFGPSDHSSFYGKQIPVMHFFTGTHPDYHRASDDTEKLNVPGMRRIGQMVVDVATEIASAEKRPKYERAGRPPAARGGERPYFGSIPDLGFDETGYKLSGVAPGGPAENGGIQAGDIIIEFGGKKIGNLDDFDLALRKYKAGDQVPTVVLRGGEKKTLHVTLDPPR